MTSAIRPLGIIIASLFGFLMIVSLYTDRSNLKLTGQEMQAKVLTTNYVISEDRVSELKDPLLVDIRDSNLYLQGHEENAINIPLSAILSEAYKPLFRSEITKVFIGYDPVTANEAWMLMTQMGYKNLYVTNLKESDSSDRQPEVKEVHPDPKKAVGNDH